MESEKSLQQLQQFNINSNNNKKKEMLTFYECGNESADVEKITPQFIACMPPQFLPKHILKNK